MKTIYFVNRDVDFLQQVKQIFLLKVADIMTYNPFNYKNSNDGFGT